MLSRLIILSLLLLDSFILVSIKNSKSVGFNCTAPNYKCYEDYYSQVTKTKGVKPAFADLKSRYDKDSFTKTICHPLTHVIGRTAVGQFQTVSEAFLRGDNFCWSGYYHGVLEGIASKMGRKNLLANLDLVCKDIPGKPTYDFNYYNCVHGLGHGLMAITDDELFQSLNYCDKLTGDWEQKSCASGVFMENIVANGIDHVTKYLKKDEPLYPCTDVAEKFKESCYLMQTSYVNQLNGYNFADTFKTCSKVEEKYRFVCYSSLGRDASGSTISNIQKTKDICLLGQDFDQKLWCFVGAANDFKSYFNDVKKGENLCRSANDDKLKSTCLKILTNS